jgi:arginine decarboxylase
MVESVRRQAERALRSGHITLPQVRMLIRHYEDSLSSYTYLTDDE